ncbi:hypothetical protein [Rhodococcus globerulus]|uniref:hypothetical protein n=1 Tax=Rhodococcus globerulus TaxID=33008 RepID=UPI002166A891|nr:hypothetical protein [Rhodococcus globerulus]
MDTAKGVLSAFSSLLAELQDIRRGVLMLPEVKGMGTLESGRALADKFSKKAIGGEDSLEKSLDSHIAVVKEMRAYFQACIDRYESVDTENAAAHGRLAIPE